MDLTDVHKHPITLEPVPTVFDRKASTTPNKPWAALPIDAKDLSKGTFDISWKSVGNAINRLAWGLADTLGASNFLDFPTVAYMGPSDVRYVFVAVALMKLGYKILLLQPNLSLEGKQGLLDRTNCSLFLHTSSTHPDDLASTIRSLKTFSVPGVDQLLLEGDVPVYPYDSRSGKSLLDPALVLHTSGSTGLPKPIVLPQAYHAVSALHIQGTRPLNGYPAGYSLFLNTRLYVGFPIAHAGGVAFALFCSMCEGVVLVLTPQGNLDGNTLTNLIEHAGVTTALTMPRVLMEVAKSESALKALEKMKILVWSGGPLPYDVGHAITQRTKLMSSWGTTESGMHALHTVDPEDWQYNHFNPLYNTFEFRPCGEIQDTDQGSKTRTLHEAVAVRNKEPMLQQRQIIFWVYPNAQEWRSGDLWSAHPTKSNLWKYEGRHDDMIILDSGHNFHPGEYVQDILLKDNRIEAAHFSGGGRPHLSVILQVREGMKVGKTSDDISNSLWPLVQRVNERSNASAQVPKNAVIIARSEKPLPKTAKGDVKRKDVEALYREELDAVYA